MQLPPALIHTLDDSSVTDILINSANETYICRGNQSQPFANIFRSEAELVDFAKLAIDLGGNHLDFVNPICDSVLTHWQLPELRSLGIARLRIHAALAHGITDQNLLSIRVHRNSQLPLEAFGQEFELEKIAKHFSFAVCGAAGSGKTTLLRTMLSLQPQLRTVLIEDSPELMPMSGHFVSLTSRAANTEGRGEINLNQLLTQSLRMRAERLVIGEVRGGEIVTLLESLNLGVKQVAFTIHANRAAQVNIRMRNLWLQRNQNSADFDCLLDGQNIKVIHLEQNRVVEIADLI